MPQFHINEETLQVQKYACHLGHPIGNENVNKIACNNALRDIVWRTNYVITKFGYCTADIRSFMFRTYCTSFYGSPLWRLSSPDYMLLGENVLEKYGMCHLEHIADI